MRVRNLRMRTVTRGQMSRCFKIERGRRTKAGGCGSEKAEESWKKLGLNTVWLLHQMSAVSGCEGYSCVVGRELHAILLLLPML